MQFDFNVGANQSQHIDVVGTFIKYKSGTGTIRVRLNGGGYIDLLPGQGVNNVHFTSVDVQDRTGAQNIGTILAGIYDFRDDRITGTVDVVDGGKARTRADAASVGYASQSGSAGVYSHVQLLNPATSGKNMYVGQVSFYAIAGATGGVAIVRWDTPLATLVGNAGRKRLAAALSPALLRVATDPTMLMMPSPGIMFAIDSGLKLAKFSEPLLIEPGQGLVVVANNKGDGVGANFEFFEEAI